MDTNIKRAIFIGISIFISIIILSTVVVSISAANKAETIAKEYKGQGIKRDASAQSLLGRDRITGEEAIYLLQAAEGEATYSISILNQKDFPENLSNTNINNDETWIKEDYDEKLSKYIKEKYSYELHVNFGSNPIKVILTWLY